ncbi:MAG: acyl-CoA dehydrogenase, partial [Planctomycetaceae bacterium]|nr:acyl-CoA dehydrogenase [Planctomycetaceae bacterium]
MVAPSAGTDEQPDPSSDIQSSESFAETALKLGGKSEEEARRTGVIDKADDQVEQLFQPQYQTVNSPIHRAVWDRGVPVELFQSDPVETPDDVTQVMDDSVEIVQRRHRDGNVMTAEGKVKDDFLDELGGAGYWGLLVDREYGGSGAP